MSSHSHEGADSREVPAQFVVELARATIDAGADHGPHVLRGIEIYKGKNGVGRVRIAGGGRDQP